MRWASVILTSRVIWPFWRARLRAVHDEQTTRSPSIRTKRKDAKTQSSRKVWVLFLIELSAFATLRLINPVVRLVRGLHRRRYFFAGGSSPGRGRSSGDNTAQASDPNA
jgi:hypothetical protein